jgi:hypothetical protein
MPTFIKAGFWEQTCKNCKGYNGWLNLDQFAGQSGTSGTSGTSGPQGAQGVQGTQGVQGVSGTSGSSGAAGDRYRTTSTTEFTLGTSTNLTLEAGLAYTSAQDIIITYDVNNHQVCTVVSYDSGTGALVIGPPVTVTGSGTYSSWTVNLDGAAGGDGSSGTSGINGTSGTTGAQGVQGIQGVAGSNGTSGTTGTSGTSGSSGLSPVLPPSVSYGLYAQTANSISVTDTTVETTIIGPGVGGLTVPANGFSIGDSFTGALDGIISSTSSSTVHIRVKTLSGALLADTGIIDLAAATDKAWIMNLYFTIRTLGGVNVASISSGGQFSYIRNGGTQFEGYVLSIVNDTTFDTTIDNTLVITAQWDTASINNSITTKNFTLTKIY